MSTDMKLPRSVRTCFIFLLLALLYGAADAQICSPPTTVHFSENNTVGAVVTTIPAQPGVTLTVTLLEPTNIENPFTFERNNLIATEVLDYESGVTVYTLRITCKDSGEVNRNTFVIIDDVNDNAPVFPKSVYDVNVNEFSPVNTSIGEFQADDRDTVQELFYTLTSETTAFALESSAQPRILVQTPLDYDKVKNVPFILILEVQDTPLPPSDIKPSHTATATIMVTIIDIDNRPPWFLPCTNTEVGGVAVCLNQGYTGRINLNEQEPGVLPLKPGPLYAIDGDSGINEALTYSILSGNEPGLFDIDADTGNITMIKVADVIGTISLTVMAAQSVNNHQFSTTSVAFTVQVKSLHPPRFERDHYEGVVTAVGTMVMDLKNKDEPLKILATDEDYAAAGGVNPYVTYTIKGSSDFSIINGFLFMTRDLPEGTLLLEVVAEDTLNPQPVTAQLTLEVTSGLTTTSLPPSTTANNVTTEEATTEEPTTEEPTTNPSTTSDSTSGSTLTTEGTFSTTNPSLTSEETVSSSSTSEPHTGVPGIPPGAYRMEDMAALGASLGVLLLISLVVIIILAVQVQRGKEDWKKIYKARMYRSSLDKGSSGQKVGNQYTNEGFQHDDDEDGGTSSGVLPGLETEKRSTPPPETVPESSSPPSDDEKDEKEVKPILTKEKRMEEGYKAVWFKEDIDPDAKEEVVIIPDRRGEEDEEDEEEEDEENEEEDNNLPMKIPKVAFAESDMDSGLSMRMEEPEDDSEEEGMMTSDL